jgi:hypothetical protein
MQESQYGETSLLQNASLVNQKKEFLALVRCICRKLLIGHRICNDVTLYSFMDVACRESWKRTSRHWNFEAKFPLEAWVTPVGLSIDSAIGLLPNLETARQERSVLLWMNKIYC